MARPKRPDDDLATEFRGETEDGAWPRPDCPSTETLERLLFAQADGLSEPDPDPPGPDQQSPHELSRKELSQEERSKVIDHLVDCSGCSALVRDLRSLEDWADRATETLTSSPSQVEPPLPFRPPTPEPSTSKRSPARNPLWRAWPAALAASLFLIVGIASVWTVTTAQQSVVGSSTDALRGPSQQTRPAPGAVLEQFPEDFAWPAQAGATTYQVVVYDRNGGTIWESERTEVPAVSVPEEADLAQAEPGSSYSWMVDVDGNVARTVLGPFRFTIPSTP